MSTAALIPSPPASIGRANASFSHCAMPLLCTSITSFSNGCSGARCNHATNKSRRSSWRLPWITIRPGSIGTRFDAISGVLTRACANPRWSYGKFARFASQDVRRGMSMTGRKKALGYTPGLLSRTGLVERRRIELPTFALRTRRSPS